MTHKPVYVVWRPLVVMLMLSAARECVAAESFEFVAEHLPESAMDNRFATLPVWGGSTTPADSWQFTVQGAVTRSGSGALELGGPLWSLAARRRLNERWSTSAFAFADALHFSGGAEQRPLDPLFTTTPLALPAMALFTDFQGRYRNIGAGVAFNYEDRGWGGAREWMIGALIQRVELRDYRAAYRVLEGPSRGAGGIVDYSGDYSHLTLLAGVALPRRYGDWSVSPHTQFALPLPRRGIQGRITGPGFDLSGDTASAGNGKHFGDFSLTLGVDVGYEPWGLSVDLGTLVSQALFERVAHKGVDQSWVLSAYMRF